MILERENQPKNPGIRKEKADKEEKDKIKSEDTHYSLLQTSNSTPKSPIELKSKTTKVLKMKMKSPSKTPVKKVKNSSKYRKYSPEKQKTPEIKKILDRMKKKKAENEARKSENKLSKTATEVPKIQSLKSNAPESLNFEDRKSLFEVKSTTLYQNGRQLTLCW